MTRLAACLCAGFLATQPTALAQPNDPKWTVSASGSWSELETSDRDAVSASVSLTRTVGNGSIGGALATSNGSDALFDQAEVTDRNSIFASAWIVVPVGEANLDLSVSYGQEDFDGRLVLGSDRFDGLSDTEIDLASEVDSFVASAAVSRVFISGNWDIIPRASLGWSQSEATTTAAAIDGVGGLGLVSEEQSGTNATLGLGLGYVASDQLYLFSDLTGFYSENGASVSVGRASRSGGLRAANRQSPEEATWAEVSLGASIYASETLTLSLVGGTTAGRDSEEVFATTTLSVGF